MRPKNSAKPTLFVLPFRQKYTTEPRLYRAGSAIWRIETTSCAVDAEGHLNARVGWSEQSSPFSGFLKLSQPI